MCPTYLYAYKAQSYKDTANIEKNQLLSKQIRQKKHYRGYHNANKWCSATPIPSMEKRSHPRPLHKGGVSYSHRY